MRLFVALGIPADVRENLAAFLKEMRALSQEMGDKCARWVRAENLHVTLKFIGEAESIKLEGIRAALGEVPSGRAMELRIRGLGFFPNEKRPTVLWTGIAAPGGLAVLADDVDQALAKRGISLEKRAFVPHLTLARFAHPAIHEKLREAIQENNEREFGSFVASEFHLMESKLKPSGAEYTAVHSFPFVAGA